MRHIGPPASSRKWPGLPKPLPLGEVAPKVTERASPARKSRCAAMVRFPFVQPLSLTSFDSSPSRGASGETVHFAGTAKASPTRGGGSASALTERLYEDGPALGSSLANLPHCACLPSGTSPQNAKPPRRSTSPGAFLLHESPRKRHGTTLP